MDKRIRRVAAAIFLFICAGLLWLLIPRSPQTLQASSDHPPFPLSVAGSENTATTIPPATPTPAPTTQSRSTFSVVDSPALACTPGDLDGYLNGKGSPLAGTGGTHVSAGQQYNVDPRLVIAIAGAESTFGRNGDCATQRHNAWGYGGGWPSCWTFDSWDAGIQQVTWQLWNYIYQRGLTNIHAIGGTWCGSGCQSWEPNVRTFYAQQGGNPDTNDLSFTGACGDVPPPDPTATPTPTPPAGDVTVLEAWPQGNSFSRGQSFHPRVVVQTSGFSLNCGENFLENRDGNLYGAHTIQGCVDQGGNRYQFAFGDPPMTAPDSSGTFHSQWQVWRWPNHIGPVIDLWFVVESPPPANCDPHPDRAILYAQTNFGGACVSLGPGDYPNPGHLGAVGNDNTRSLRVGQNVRLTLYENDNFEGRRSVYDASEVHDLRDHEIGYDTSSARVEQKPPTATPTPTTPPTATPTPTPTPTPQTAACPGTIAGWKGEYWSNETFTGSPVLCRDDAAIDFEWTDSSPDPLVPVNHFSARWTRTLSFPADTYQFDVFHDDGARLYVDGVLVLDNWCADCRVSDSVRRDLPAGNHTIRLEVRENTGWAAARLGWQTVSSPTSFHLLLPALIRANAPANLPIVNGDFEQGPGVGWSEYSAHGWPLLIHADSFPVIPYSGNWAAWLGGEFDEIAFIEQSVTVPADSSILRFAYWIASEDQCGFDFGGVVLNGADVADIFDLCGPQGMASWGWRSVNLSAYAGQRVSLQIRAETDSTLNSNLFVDDAHWSAQTVGPAQAGFDLQNRPTPTANQASHRQPAAQKAATRPLIAQALPTDPIEPQPRFWTLRISRE